MIMGRFGFNGSGKTISMVRSLMTDYGVIFCNFGYKPTLDKAGLPRQLVVQCVETDELLIALEQYITSVGGIKGMKGKTVCLAIDEAGLAFPARSFKQLTKRELFLFAQHRKYHIDFQYTSQAPSMIDSILRANTAMAGFCWHFYGYGFVNWYAGVQKRKETKLWNTFYDLKPAYSHYDTFEIVDTTKSYLQDSVVPLKEVQKLVSASKIMLPAGVYDPIKDFSK